MRQIIISANRLSKISAIILAVSFVLFYLVDGYSKVILRNTSQYTFYSAAIKGIFQLLVFVYIIITLNKLKANILLGVLLLTCCFLTGQYFLSSRFIDLDFSQNFSTFLKFIFPLLFFCLVVDAKNKAGHSKIVVSSYKIVLTLNAFLIIVGFLLDSYVLRTYEGPWRFGFNGLILAQNESTFVFIFAATAVYYRRYYLRIKEGFFWIVMTTTLFVATKAIFLFLALLLLFHLIQRVSLKSIFAVGSLLSLTAYTLFSSTLNVVFLNAYEVFMYTYYKEGLWFALLSGRNVYIKDKIYPLVFEYWSLPNLFFGGQDVTAHYIEMGFFDLFLFFGTIGAVLYLFIFYSIFKTLPFTKNFKLFFGVTILIIIATAGHFFESGIAGIHFLFLFFLTDKSEIDKSRVNESHKT